MAAEKEKSAILIQKICRGRMEREKVQMLKESKYRKGYKELIKKMILSLPRHVRGDKGHTKLRSHDFYLNIFANEKTKVLSFYLIDSKDKSKYVLEQSFSEAPIDLSRKFMNPHNLDIIISFADDIVKKFYILDEDLLLYDPSLHEKSQESKKRHSRISRTSNFYLYLIFY